MANMLNEHLGPTFLHIYKNTTKCNFYFTCYCQICARNKHTQQNGLICQMLYVHKCVTYGVCALKLWPFQSGTVGNQFTNFFSWTFHKISTFTIKTDFCQPNVSLHNLFFHFSCTGPPLLIISSFIFLSVYTTCMNVSKG